MAKVWDPKKNIPLFTTDAFPCKWESIIDEPYPGMLVGTGWLTPKWINRRGHSEREYQKCIIHHWPRTLVPEGISENDKIGDMVGKVIDLLKQFGKDDGISSDMIESAGNFAYQLFKYMSEGPVKGIPLFNLLNKDGSLTFIYAHWYEGTPVNLQWVVDVNWTRHNRLNVMNEQVLQLEDVSTLRTIEVFPEVPASEMAESGSLWVPKAMVSNSKEKDEGLASARGIFEPYYSFDSGGYRLLNPASGNTMMNLVSGDLALDRVPEFVDGAIVEVMGEKVVNSTINLGEPAFTLYVDSLTVLKVDNEILFPALELSEEILDEPVTQEESISIFSRTCSTDIRKKISKEAREIEEAGKRLKKINWKKYGTIAGMVVGLVSATVAAAAGVASSAVGGGAIAAALLQAKVLALYKAVSTLKILDDSAKKDLALMKKSQDNIKGLRKRHPECFKKGRNGRTKPLGMSKAQ